MKANSFVMFPVFERNDGVFQLKIKDYVDFQK